VTRTSLVTGGAGFIGSHLVDRLLERGDRVVVIDDLSSGRQEHLDPRARFHRLDIRSADVRQLVATVSPDLVFHLAAQMSVAVSAREPVRDAEINVLGTLNLLEGVRAAAGPDGRMAKLVFASSGGAVYGEPETLPVPESHPCRPVSPYGAAKAACETYLGTYRAVYGLEYAVMRLANVYGPRQDPYGEAGVVAIFGEAMLKGAPVRIFGDGTDERDYVYVADVVAAFELGAEAGQPGPYNIGSGEGTSVSALATQIASLTGYRKAPVHGPPRQGDLHRIRLDCTKARRELGWTPATTLADGLAKTIDYLRPRQ
jgi:UDP-glucose 4-epimerase